MLSIGREIDFFWRVSEPTQTLDVFQPNFRRSLPLPLIESRRGTWPDRDERWEKTNYILIGCVRMAGNKMFHTWSRSYRMQGDGNRFLLLFSLDNYGPTRNWPLWECLFCTKTMAGHFVWILEEIQKVSAASELACRCVMRCNHPLIIITHLNEKDRST